MGAKCARFSAHVALGRRVDEVPILSLDEEVDGARGMLPGANRLKGVGEDVRSEISKWQAIFLSI